MEVKYPAFIVVDQSDHGQSRHDQWLTGLRLQAPGLLAVSVGHLNTLVLVEPVSIQHFQHEDLEACMATQSVAATLAKEHHSIHSVLMHIAWIFTVNTACSKSRYSKHCDNCVPHLTIS